MDIKLEKFESISLSQMEGIRLMKRVDRKFMIPFDLLPQLLDELIEDYYMQEIEEKRLFEYSTLYYDTPDYEMYTAHQNGKLNRLKVRTREYVDSNLCFLEIKTKSNSGVTRKIRIASKTPHSIAETDSSLFLCSHTPYFTELLEGKLWSFYKRITLVNKMKTERLTIDYNLCFQNKSTGRKVVLPEMVIIELKKDQSSFSPVTNSLNRLRIKPKGISKYCLGVALTETGECIKKNMFKSKILTINKLTSFQYD